MKGITHYLIVAECRLTEEYWKNNYLILFSDLQFFGQYQQERCLDSWK